MQQQVEVFFHSQQPYTYVQDEDLAQYPSGRLDFPNRYFDPVRAHQLYNQYHEQYAWADEVGLDGIMTNEHHASYWNMKPSANLDAAVLSKVTRQARLAILGNILPICDPVRMAEELAMVDCYSGGRLISGFVRGGRWRPSRPASIPPRIARGLKRPTTSSCSAGPRRARFAGRAGITRTGW